MLKKVGVGLMGMWISRLGRERPARYGPRPGGRSRRFATRRARRYHCRSRSLADPMRLPSLAAYFTGRQIGGSRRVSLRPVESLRPAVLFVQLLLRREDRLARARLQRAR